MRIALNKQTGQVVQSLANGLKWVPNNLLGEEAVRKSTSANVKLPEGSFQEHQLYTLTNQKSVENHSAPNRISEQTLNISFKIDLLASRLNRCSKSKALSDGKCLHELICKRGFDHETFLRNCLVEMYGNCGSTENARTVFDLIHHPNSHSWNIMMKAYTRNGNLCDASSLFRTMPDRDIVSWNTMIGGFADHGYDKDALCLFSQMQFEGIKPDKITFVCVLDACASLVSLEEGQCIHTVIVDFGYDQDVMVATALISMYGKCGSLCGAKNVFQKMPWRDVVTWSVIIATLTQNAYGKEALYHFRQMQLEGVKPDKISFACALDACASLKEGLEIHAAVVDHELDGDTVIGNTLIKMYGKFGSVESAVDVFEGIHHRDVSSWNAIMTACTQNGHVEEGLDLFCRMQPEGVKPDKVTFVSAVDACAILSALEWGKKVHAVIVESGYEDDVVVGNTLVNMYGKCGSVHGASSVFVSLLHRDVISWSTMIAAYSQNGHGQEALELFKQMQLEGIKADRISLLCVLDACASLVALEQGLRIHAASIVSGDGQDVVVGNALISMYGKCGNVHLASSVFAGMSHQDVVSWNAMIAAFAQNGHHERALGLFRQMKVEGVKPDKVTFICSIDACASLAAFEEGQKVHAALVDIAYEPDVVLGTSLISMYGKCRCLPNAKNVFSRLPYCNVSSWNAMIAACAQCGHGKMALHLFFQMQLEGMQADKITFVAALDACVSVSAFEDGQKIHAMILFMEYERDILVGTALLSMYAECGSLHDATDIFCRLPHSNTVFWNAMISAFAQNGLDKEALDLFHQMKLEAVMPDKATFVCTLNACASLAALEQEYRIHASLIDAGFAGDMMVETALIDSYGKCGNHNDARKVFDGMAYRDIVSWNAMMAAYAQNGFSREALDAFIQMQLVGTMKPDKISFICILTACSHTGQGIWMRQRTCSTICHLQILLWHACACLLPAESMMM